VPFALVAERDGSACGNALVIQNDLAERPELKPWLAALWVDKPMRQRGVASALLEEGVRRAGALGVERLFLSSRAALQGFYTGLGWTIIEQGVGPHVQTVYFRRASSA
jgi:GNAT superfamily N-acetyltransferase